MGVEGITLALFNQVGGVLACACICTSCVPPPESCMHAMADAQDTAKASTGAMSSIEGIARVSQNG
eukprot:COSAG01_NODE_1090_length_11748_cov_58.142244_14_plen_66_part_00